MYRPNFLFILMDDLGWKDIGCMGSEYYETPNIDRLRGEGMLFTDAYSACPVCSPTRASIMSGKYPARLGLTDWIDSGNCHPYRGRDLKDGRHLVEAPYVRQLSAGEKSMASALRENGYQTWHVGKWHLGDEPYWPEHHGFDVNIGGCHYGHPKNGYFSPWNIPNLDDGPPGEYLPDKLTGEALKLIAGRNQEKPFFLNLWYYCVHTPIQAKEKKIEKYRKKAARLGLDRIDPFVDGDFFPVKHKETQRIRRRIVQSDPVYAAMIESVDENIGRLMDKLEEEGILDQTVIVFTSDNGGLATAEGSPTCNAPLSEGKGWMYEGGTREPLLIRYPFIIKGNSTCATPVTSPDFYPTLLELAGLLLLPEQHTDGVSLVPLLKGGKHLKREAIFWHYPHYGNQGGTPGSSIREGDWKLIEFYEDGRLELYNLRTDIGEDRNAVMQYPDIAAELHEKLRKWRLDLGALYPRVVR